MSCPVSRWDGTYIDIDTASAPSPSCVNTSPIPTTKPTIQAGRSSRTRSGVSFLPTRAFIHGTTFNHPPPPTRCKKNLTSSSTVALEVNIAIIVACLPALSPLLKGMPLLASLLPSAIRTRFSHASAMERAPWPKKLSGPNCDVEQSRDLPAQAPHASWQKPKAWRDAERREFGGSDGSSDGSGAESVQSMYRASAEGTGWR